MEDVAFRILGLPASELTVGDSLQLSGVATNRKGVEHTVASVRWASFGGFAVRVDGRGLLRALAPGAATVSAEYLRMKSEAPVRVAVGPQVPESLTPPELLPVVGPLILRGVVRTETAVAVHDALFERTEPELFQRYMDCEDRCYLLAQHYGGLRGRLMWALRNAESIGPAAPDPNRDIYARGSRIVHRYLKYSINADYRVPVQNNTGLADVEALYILEGTPEALSHIRSTAQGYTTDQYNYLNLRNDKSGARIPAIALESFNAAHRLGIPYARDPGINKGFDDAHGSWIGAGRWLVERLLATDAIQADGTIISPSNGAGTETYFMNAMLATELLRWHGYVEPQPTWVALAQRIMDHLIEAKSMRYANLQSLPYTSARRAEAVDLAGYYVWPSLVLWQETGDPKYRQFALDNLLAATNAKTIHMLKQWNQVFSTRTQGAEALLAGVSWK